jgi:hypothetical protein
MLSFICRACDSVWGFLGGSESVQVFIMLAYISALSFID